MYFITDVESYEEENGLIRQKGLVCADSYVGAMEQLEKFYGKEIECVHLIEAITDNSVVILTDIAEEEIREHDWNTWF